MAIHNPELAQKIEAEVFAGKWRRFNPDKPYGRRVTAVISAPGHSVIAAVSAHPDTGALSFTGIDPDDPLPGGGSKVVHEEVDYERAARITARILRERPSPRDGAIYPDYR